MTRPKIEGRQTNGLHLAGTVSSAGPAVSQDEVLPTLNVACCPANPHDIRADLVQNKRQKLKPGQRGCFLVRSTPAKPLFLDLDTSEKDIPATHCPESGT